MTKVCLVFDNTECAALEKLVKKGNFFLLNKKESVAMAGTNWQEQLYDWKFGKVKGKLYKHIFFVVVVYFIKYIYMYFM